jgi:hypothetical protein
MTECRSISAAIEKKVKILTKLRNLSKPLRGKETIGYETGQIDKAIWLDECPNCWRV